MTINSTLIIEKINALSAHQSWILGGLAILFFLVMLTFITKSRFTEEQYKRTLAVWYWPAFFLGIYSTYAGVYLAWNQAADPTTIALLFLGGAVGMSLSGNTPPWAWLAAPLVAGVGTMELWGFLAADPGLWTSAGAIVALTLPTFIVMLYLQQAHSSLGIIVIKGRVTAFILASVMLVQAVVLPFGLSLNTPLLAAVTNALLKLGVI